MEEALLCYRGKVDEWRLFRAGIDVIHCSLVSKGRANIREVIPLPFDDEIDVKPDDLFEMYRQYMEQQKITADA